jgi:hypothetical protein
MSAGLLWLVSVATWLSPMPQHSMGLLVNYGDQSYIEGNAEFRGYDLSHYPRRCGVASVTPSLLGRIVWVRRENTAWYGPCLVVDVMARHHFYDGVYVKHEILEVPRWLCDWLGFQNGAQGYVWVGQHPPDRAPGPAREHQPWLTLDTGQDAHPLFWPYPPQQLPVRESIPYGYMEAK